VCLALWEGEMALRHLTRNRGAGRPA
jgi:hypothetical protein